MGNDLSTTSHPVVALKRFLSANDIQSRLKEMLGERASSFSNSIINVVSSNNALQACDPTTIVKAAMISASLNLPIDPALGFSAIVPYKEAAQFQLMYKGVIQLCIRSGQYETIHDTEVYRDELAHHNPITGEVTFRELTEYKMRPQHNWDDVVGFYCCFRLLKGFRASLYMTKEEVMAHAERFSKAYQNDLKYKKQSCPWSTDPIAMGRKTVILRLLKRYGIMSVEMQEAVVADAEDENHTRHVDSTSLEPTDGRQGFELKKPDPETQPTADTQTPQGAGSEPEKDTEETKIRMCPACKTPQAGKFFRSNGRLVCKGCFAKDNGTTVDDAKSPTPSQAPEGQGGATKEPEGATDRKESGPAHGETPDANAECECGQGHKFKFSEAIQEEGGAVTCPQCREYLKEIHPPTQQPKDPGPTKATTAAKAPSGVVTCRYGHTVAREAIMHSPVCNKAKGELGLCPTCKAGGKPIVIRESEQK